MDASPPRQGRVPTAPGPREATMDSERPASQERGPAPLTKPLPMTRQSPLTESHSLLVKWNCASCELRNRGPRVVWGRQGHRRVTAGLRGSGGHAGGRGGAHQQLLRDQLHDQLLWPLVGLPAGGEGQRGPGPRPPAHVPTGRALTGSRPGSRRPGRAGSASASPWSPNRVCASVARGLTGHSPGARAGPPPTGADGALGATPSPTGTHGGPEGPLTSCHSRTPLQASSLLLSRCSPTTRPPRASPGEDGPMGPRAPKTRAPCCGRGVGKLRLGDAQGQAVPNTPRREHTPMITPHFHAQKPPRPYLNLLFQGSRPHVADPPHPFPATTPGPSPRSSLVT